MVRNFDEARIIRNFVEVLEMGNRNPVSKAERNQITTREE
jgi:hypothetical protein